MTSKEGTGRYLISYQVIMKQQTRGFTTEILNPWIKNQDTGDTNRNNIIILTRL